MILGAVEDHEAADQVPEPAHVARPAVAREWQFGSAAVERLRLQPSPRACFEEAADGDPGMSSVRSRNGRQPGRHDVQPVEQVLAEQALPDQRAADR